MYLAIWVRDDCSHIITVIRGRSRISFCGIQGLHTTIFPRYGDLRPERISTDSHLLHTNYTNSK